MNNHLLLPVMSAVFVAYGGLGFAQQSLPENQSVSEALESYAEERQQVEEASNSYTFYISIDNQTDSNFDDSIFAWDYYGQGGGGMATGYSWPAYSNLTISVNSGGCVKSGGGDLYEGSERTKLEPYEDAGEGYCWTRWGWRVFYEEVDGTQELRLERVEQRHLQD